MRQEAPVAEDLDVHREDRRRPVAPPTFGRQAFGQEAERHHQRDEAIGGEEPEDRAPAEDFQHDAAQHRRQDRRGTHHQHQARHHPHGAAIVEQVAHHRARHHDARAAPERLHQAQPGQRLGRGRDGASG
jgi:hypothetical protein